MNEIIKIALENTVLIRGAHGPIESYEYAEKMERVIKSSLVERLRTIIVNPETAVEDIEKFIVELEK
jgi:Mn-dependent DtxR family transcriptional regulator